MGRFGHFLIEFLWVCNAVFPITIISSVWLFIGSRRIQGQEDE